MKLSPLRMLIARSSLLIAAAVLLCLAAATGASASTIEVTATPNPATAGAAVTLTNVGLSTNPEESAQIYDYYEPNLAPCAPTAANERGRSSGAAFITTLQFGTQLNFSEQTSFTPVGSATGAYRVCAYLVSGGNDSAAPDALGTTILNVTPTRAQLLSRALRKCHKIKRRGPRTRCIRAARHRYSMPSTPHGMGA